MKTVKIKLYSWRVLVRAAIVFIGGAALVFAGANIVRVWLDTIQRQTGSNIVLQLFYWLSANRSLVAIIGCLLALFLFSGWIIRPAFNQLAGVVRDGIRFDGSDIPVHLSKDMKEMEDALNETNQAIRAERLAAKETEQRKEELVVCLAHDLRTPLTTVLGYLELLVESEGLPPEKQRRFAATAQRKAQRMQTLVDELFEVTRFNMNRLELEKEDVNAGVLALQLAEEAEPQAKQAGVNIHVENNGLQTVFVDPEKLARVLDNVLQNAVRHTPRGGDIIITLDHLATGAPRIRIANTGAEIPQEKLERIFEKFYRGDEARQSGTGGSGLGLAIARRIIEAHGGNITAQSENRTTTFTILLGDV